MSFFENTRKPVGLGGKIMVAMMNFGHSAMAEWGLSFLQPAPDAMVLDCGCGGGANIKTLLKLCPNGKVQGIDYSAVSVEKARKVNAGAIAAGRCTVQQASVAELPFEAEQFEVVTAFETVYFWPELAQNFREVYRVLKPGGIFFICNEANGETTKDDRWTQIIDGMTIYTDTALKEYLEQAGFCQIKATKIKRAGFALRRKSGHMRRESAGGKPGPRRCGGPVADGVLGLRRPGERYCRNRNTWNSEEHGVVCLPESRMRRTGRNL